MAFPDQEREARLLLSLHDPLGPVRFARLLDRFGSGVEALRAGPIGWKDVEGIGDRAADHFFALERSVQRLGQAIETAHRLKIRWVCGVDEEYPEPFRALRDAPVVLYVRGAFHPVDALGVAVVGSRRPSAYGRSAAERLARELASAGVTVVSGLARGIDGWAHRAALAAGGRTVGFLGSGFSYFYPAEHRGLADRMAERGAVATEFALDAPPDPSHFPRRNRLISALSVGVVVVEALEKSGALITAGLAAEQGREVFAVPGSVFSPLSQGPHRLLRQGAKLVERVEDILEEIAVFKTLAQEGRTKRSMGDPALPSGLSARAHALLALLTLEPAGIDGLTRQSGLAPAEVLRELLSLELAGLVRALPGKHYVRKEAYAQIAPHR